MKFLFNKRNTILLITICILMHITFSSVVLAESSQKILITIAHSGDRDSKIFRNFNRSYQPTKNYGSELQVKRQIKAIARNYNLIETEDAWTIKPLNVYCALLTLPENTTLEVIIDKLKRDKRIESVQPVYSYSSRVSEKLEKELLSESLHNNEYNDPYFSVQYKNMQKTVEQLHKQATGKGIRIAIIDTGVDTYHSDLGDQILKTRNFVDDDPEQFNNDIHGTAITGIIAAKPNNDLGIVGLAPDAELWVLKACWQIQQLSDIAECNSFTIASALSVGIDENVDIINLSLSGPRDPLVERLIEVAIKRGIVVVAADPIHSENRYPALLSGVIDVQQVSSYEKHVNVTEQILLSASLENRTVRVDGTDILTTAPNNGFEFFSGSSMSTAIVSALGALLLERDGNLDIEKLKQIISQSFAAKRGKH